VIGSLEKVGWTRLSRLRGCRRLGDAWHECAGCHGRTSATAGAPGASLAGRWLLGTRQGSVAEAHLSASLDELPLVSGPQSGIKINWLAQLLLV